MDTWAQPAGESGHPGNTWAGRLLQSGISTFDLMKLGGWSDSEMINTRYGHFADEDQRAALERLSGTVGDLPK